MAGGEKAAVARRFKGRMSGERYLANANPTQREVHDLDNEQSRCQIDEIIAASNERPYHTLAAAQEAGYDNCHYCIGSSQR